MTRTRWKIPTGAALLAACALGGATLAFGADTKHATLASTTTSKTTTNGTQHTRETPLTGDVLAKVTAAAIAKVGGTVDSATTENDSTNAAAAYEAHVTKVDGTHVTVILDKSYTVLAVETGHRPGGRDHHGHGPGNGETALTGDVAARAKAAAVARTGGTAEEATTENDSSNQAAAYEVHVTKTDGSRVTVILDKDFAVLAVETHEGHGPGDHHR